MEAVKVICISLEGFGLEDRFLSGTVTSDAFEYVMQFGDCKAYACPSGPISQTPKTASHEVITHTFDLITSNLNMQKQQLRHYVTLSDQTLNDSSRNTRLSFPVQLLDSSQIGPKRSARTNKQSKNIIFELNLGFKDMPYNPIPENFVPEGHADEEGDMIFLLDTNSRSPKGQHHPLKVSSQVMSRASPVFQAMFNPRFTGVADFSSTDPLEIHLEDDDCQATVWLCFGLHLQDLPEGRMPLALLKRLAILVDKYDCARAMQPWSRSWLIDWSESISHTDYWALLWISYVLRDHQAFSKASEQLIYWEKVADLPFDEKSDDTIGLSLLPSGLEGKSPLRRRYAIRR